VKRFRHIVLVLLAAAACQGPRVIPKDTLTDIYTDMFLADQMVRDENVPRARMDTLLLYEAVFQKYGYDTDDYLYSVRQYLKDPERFAKVFESVAKRLEGEVKAMDKIIEHRAWVASRLDAEYPLVDSLLAPFSKESVFVGLARVARDTSRYPAWFRMMAVHEDTLMVSVDSLEARAAKDSLAAKAPADSAAKEKVEEPKRLSGKPAVKPKQERERVRPHGRPRGGRALEIEEVAVDEEAVVE
jgi:hypothetical protein